MGQFGLFEMTTFTNRRFKEGVRNCACLIGHYANSFTMNKRLLSSKMTIRVVSHIRDFPFYIISDYNCDVISADKKLLEHSKCLLLSKTLLQQSYKLFELQYTVLSCPSQRKWQKS